MQFALLLLLQCYFPPCATQTGSTSPTYWVNPPDSGRAEFYSTDAVFQLGSTVNLQWVTNLSYYSIYLFQQQSTPYAIGGSSIYSKALSDPELGGFSWKVSPQSFSLSQSPVYFFSLAPSLDLSNNAFTCHYFNISDGPVSTTLLGLVPTTPSLITLTSTLTTSSQSSSSTVASSTISSASSVSTSTNNVASSAATGQAATDGSISHNTQIGLGAGLGIGIPIVLLLTAVVVLMYLRIRDKKRRPTGLDEGDSGTELHPMTQRPGELHAQEKSIQRSELYTDVQPVELRAREKRHGPIELPTH